MYSRLLLCLPAAPEQKPVAAADRPALRLLVRETRGEPWPWFWRGGMSRSAVARHLA